MAKPWTLPDFHPSSSTNFSAGDIGDLRALTAAIASGIPVYNVASDYGATAAGSSSGDRDTQALQAAINDASASAGVVLLPPPSTNASGAYYNINDTITIYPQGSAATHTLTIIGYGNRTPIAWTGASGKPVFRVRGLKESWIQGVRVKLVGTTSICIWDLDATDTVNSMSNVDFVGCAGICSSGATKSIFLRGGHYGKNGLTSGGVNVEDISHIRGYGCTMTSADGTETIWVANQNANCLDWSFFGGGGGHCDIQFTNDCTDDPGTINGAPGNATANGGSNVGGADMHFYGTGGSGNATCDFRCAAAGAYEISGCRQENGKVFYDTGTASTKAVQTAIRGCSIVNYNNTTGTPAQKIFKHNSGGSLVFDNTRINNGAAHAGDYDANLIYLEPSAGAFGSLFFRGGGVTGTYPFWTAAAGTWEITVQGVVKTATVGGAATAMHPNRYAAPQTYAATNVTTDRAYDADATTTAELADVLGTLIADLRTAGIVL